MKFNSKPDSPYLYCHKVMHVLLSHRSPSTHKMSPWVKKVFLELMPRFLCMKRPEYRPIYAYEGDFTATSATAGNNDYGMNFGTGYDIFLLHLPNITPLVPHPAGTYFTES